MIFKTTLLLALIGAVGCASTGAGGGVETTAFATSTGVDIATMTKAAGGFWYRDLVVGQGPEAASGREVSIKYRGMLTDGTVVDETKSDGNPFLFRLGQATVIRGWEQGLLGMRPGGKRLLVLPPWLGYGNREQGRIPRNAILVFEVELLGLR